MAHPFLALLDGSQTAAATHDRGPLRVVAGAGTGKTRVLTTRAAWLVMERGRDPRRIVATTFTNKAAREIRQRAVALGGDALAGLRVTTLHSLAARLLRRYWKEAGFAAPDWLIAEDDEVFKLVGAAVDASGLFPPRPAGDAKQWAAERRQYVKDAAARIGRWKENGLTEAMVRDPGRRRRSEADEAFAAVYLLYQEELARRNMVDFGDLGLRAVALLEGDPAVLDEVAGEIEYLMVDEFQDTNRVQLRFVRLLSSRHGNLMVVGDDDQSLYSFRSVVERLMAKMGGPGVADVRLERNRRCTDQILRPANLLVDYNTRDEPKVLLSGRDGGEVGVTAYPTEDAEGEGVAQAVLGLLAEGVPASEIAVLVRSSYAAEPVLKALAKHNVAHRAQAGVGFLDRAEVKDVIAYLQLAINPYLDVAFERILAKPTRGLGQSALEAILAVARRNGSPLHEACAAFASAPGLKAEAREAARALSRQLAILAEAARSFEPSEAIVRYVLEQVGYADWAYSQPDAPRRLRSSFEILLSLASEAPVAIEFANDLSLRAEEQDDEEAGAVHVGTIHGAKGLEWDHVFLPAFEEGVVPNPRALEEGGRGDPDDPWDVECGGGIEEERRIAHVAFTRARHGVRVSFAAVRGHGPMRKPSKPSRFLREAELPVPKPAPALVGGGGWPGKGGKGKAAAPKKQRFW